MEFINSWLKSIVIYSLLATIITNILPNDSYKKYTKIFIGMVLIIVIIKPFSNLINMDNYLSYDVLVENLNLEAMAVSNSSFVNNKSVYEDTLKKQISSQLIASGYEVVSVDIAIDGNNNDFSINDIQLVVNKTSSSSNISVDKVQVISVSESNGNSEEENKVKSLISDFYNLDINNINVKIQE